MTWIELVKEYFPDATDTQCEFILWEKTAFPVTGEETIRKQLKEYKQELEEYRKAK
ncbi:hypothetical protein [Heyndrickxia ginsengihumi]|uniref:hypothetical protein n=1 Tax=Heyndrickxia ginsengihumi TaxID=363870 RepID=UPI0004ACA3F4|nr:hypothetical protein [Heyndrickxia ginsengihumi]